MKAQHRQLIVLCVFFLMLGVGVTRYFMLKHSYAPLVTQLHQSTEEYKQLLLNILKEYSIPEEKCSITFTFNVFPEFYVFGDPVGIQYVQVEFTDKTGEKHTLTDKKKGWYSDGVWTGVISSKLNYKSLEDRLRETLSKIQ